MESSGDKCGVCQKHATAACSRCKSIKYCSTECQKQDWKKHKLACGKKPAEQPASKALYKKKIEKLSNELIDKDNLKIDESVGTFRWNDSMQLINAPEWKDEMKDILPQLNGGWEAYVEDRFQHTAAPGSDQITVEPHQLDGLSFSMTLVRLIALIRMYKHKEVEFVIMGASAKVEERLFCKTNYYEELTNFFPEMTLKFYFTGPELSSNHSLQKNPRLSAQFYRGMTSEFLSSLGNQTGDEAHDQQEIFKALDKKKTLFLGYNPGFGSGYEPLLHSWCNDICQLLDLRYAIFFTQANDFSDLKGEQRVFEQIFENKARFTLAPDKNPFRAMTHYQGEGEAGKNVWCCANTHMYGFQGWANPNDAGGRLTKQQVKQNIKSNEGQRMLKELELQSKLGGPVS